MHPAKSVVLFTTASGAGYGLLVWLALFGAAKLIEPEFWFGLAGFGFAFALIVIGLLSSTFHLGHPERAWRAMSQWRSSWLSREGLIALITFVPGGLYAASWILLGQNAGFSAIIGLIGALCALVTVYCTAMIYASLKAIPAWHNAWTPPAYLGLSMMTGAVLLNMLCTLWPSEASIVTRIIALVALPGGLVVKLAYWRAALGAEPVSTSGSATGLANLGEVQLLDPPHGTDNYLMKEMGFRIARKHASRLRQIAIALGFVLPFGLVWAGGSEAGGFAAMLAVAAALSCATGIATERWLFFAEAKHVVQLYYGELAV